GVRIRERGRAHRAPGEPAVLGVDAHDATLPAAAERGELRSPELEERRLDRAELLAVVHRADALPRASEVARDLEMDLPAVVLGARRAKERSVHEKDRLVANGAEDRLGESTRLGPRRSRVSRLREHSPPGARAGPDLVEEEEALRVDRVEDRVPARVAKVLVLDPVRD